MTNNDAINNLNNTLRDLDSAKKWLVRSYKKCEKIVNNNAYTDDDFDHLENLTSRYGRVIDILLNKVFRSIDIVEFLDKGTLLDAVNRAEKRNIISSADTLRTMKDLRNEIVHEYSTATLIKIFKEAFKSSKALLEICDNVEKYCAKYQKLP